MIRTNELRIGNLIELSEDTLSFKKLFPSKYVQVDGIKRNDVLIDTPIGLRSVIGYNPIPLTEEILLKVGFKVSINKTCYGMITESGRTRLSIFHDGLFKVSCEDLEIKVKHLHQLQNLFFTLTGRELEVKL